MRVILISGKAEAGKTLTANLIKTRLEDMNPLTKAVIIPYGDYVKSTARLVWGWNGEKDKAGRELLQRWGTDMVRENHPYFWIDTVKRLVDVITPYVQYVIIDDCRFPNEILAWEGYSYLHIRVERPNHRNALTDEQRCHPSETALDGFPFDFEITAENREELDDIINGMVINNGKSFINYFLDYFEDKERTDECC